MHREGGAPAAAVGEVAVAHNAQPVARRAAVASSTSRVRSASILGQSAAAGGARNARGLAIPPGPPGLLIVGLERVLGAP